MIHFSKKGIRHISEEQYLEMEKSNYYDYSTILPYTTEHDASQAGITTHGEVYEAPMQKYCINFLNKWQTRWFMIDSTKLRYVQK
jgi:hypothetical protein